MFESCSDAGYCVLFDPIACATSKKIPWLLTWGLTTFTPQYDEFDNSEAPWPDSRFGRFIRWPNRKTLGQSYGFAARPPKIGAADLAVNSPKPSAEKTPSPPVFRKAATRSYRVNFMRGRPVPQTYSSYCILSSALRCRHFL